MCLKLDNTFKNATETPERQEDIMINHHKKKVRIGAKGAQRANL